MTAPAKATVGVLLAGLMLASAPAAGAAPPNAPTITEPSADGKILNPADVHMEATGFSDTDGDTHACSDWEIWSASPSEPVWQAPCAGGVLKVHIHLGDGSFVNSYAGRTDLKFDGDYKLRVRFRDSAGEASAWSERPFRTSTQGPPGTPAAIPWAVRQPGYEVQVVATGLQLPVNVAPVPNPGSGPSDPFMYVSELYGKIAVISRGGTVSDYATGLLNFNPTGAFPGSGEQGVTGITVDPGSGDVFASMVYEDTSSKTDPKPHYPKVVRFHSQDGGKTAASQSTVLDMHGELQGPSHQISNLTIGPDGKLYVHNGDGFDSTTAQDLESFRGKVLRMSLGGVAAPDNPFYDTSDGITARDYVFAYGFRNPFGGAWRSQDGAHYEVEDGPSVDRFAKVVAGRNFGWDGTEASMYNFALFSWWPAHAPVNVAFVQPQTSFGSGFPFEKMGHAFVTESGPTYATGPQSVGKRIVEFAPTAGGDFAGSSPVPLVEYTGIGKATAVGLAAGPDGLYFTDLYKDVDYTSPIDPGANLLRVRWTGDLTPPAVSVSNPADGSHVNHPPSTLSGAAGGEPTDSQTVTVSIWSGGSADGPPLSTTDVSRSGTSWSLALPALADGTFTVRAQQTDSRANTGQSTSTFTVDTVPPETTIASGPSGGVDSASASFGFDSNEPGSSFECALDGAAFGACRSPEEYSGLSQGWHTFQVRAIDAAGNADGSPESRAWHVDKVPPFGLAPTIAPVFSRVSLSASEFYVGSRATAVSQARRRITAGTTIRYILSKPATVRMVVERKLAGRRRGRLCVPPTRALRLANRCTRHSWDGVLERAGRAGANSVGFSGRIGRSALAPGYYRLTIGATDAAGNSAKVKRLSFRILAKPRPSR